MKWISAVDVSRELGVGVDLGLGLAPVVRGSPVLRQVPQIRNRRAVTPIKFRRVIWPACPREALPQIVEQDLGNRELKWRNRIRYLFGAEHSCFFPPPGNRHRAMDQLPVPGETWSSPDHVSSDTCPMRADRLVALLLLLQASGRVTAAEVAAELEVSLKTARRDLEALAMAGIPVYSQPGRAGGWQLLGGGRTDLSGLTAAEAGALFLVAGPSTALAPEAKAALRKLARALPVTLREPAESAAGATVLDSVSWGGVTPPHSAHVADLQRAVIESVQARFTYQDREGAVSERQADPLGVVAKAGAWYFVAQTAAGRRTSRVNRITSLTLTSHPADRPQDFDLSRAWQEIAANIDQLRTRVTATVQTTNVALEGLRTQFGTDMSEPLALADGIFEVELGGGSYEALAEPLAGWGSSLIVADPEEVRVRLAEIGSELVAVYCTDDQAAGTHTATSERRWSD
jgi:predicted DNA-binding transcriptional regulator YafY